MPGRRERPSSMKVMSCPRAGCGRSACPVVCGASVRKAYEDRKASAAETDRGELEERQRVVGEVLDILARRRQRFSQAIVRSTTQRIGRTSKPLGVVGSFSISTASPGRRLATAWANCGPW